LEQCCFQWNSLFASVQAQIPVFFACDYTWGFDTPDSAATPFCLTRAKPKSIFSPVSLPPQPYPGIPATLSGSSISFTLWIAYKGCPPSIWMSVSTPIVFMDSNNKRSWNILNWNVRGLNSDDKRNAIRAKIEESACAIFWPQETKSQSFDSSRVRKMAPKGFGKFAYTPLEGASGEILAGWNNSFNSLFLGEVLSTSKFQITIKFTIVHNVESWILSLSMGPVMVSKGRNSLTG
jgi:hypothetical protein